MERLLDCVLNARRNGKMNICRRGAMNTLIISEIICEVIVGENGFLFH